MWAKRLECIAAINTNTAGNVHDEDDDSIYQHHRQQKRQNDPSGDYLSHVDRNVRTSRSGCSGSSEYVIISINIIYVTGPQPSTTVVLPKPPRASSSTSSIIITWSSCNGSTTYPISTLDPNFAAPIAYNDDALHRTRATPRSHQASIGRIVRQMLAYEPDARCVWGQTYRSRFTRTRRGYDESADKSGTCITPKKRGVATSQGGRRETAGGV